jgi:proton-dependent oligopeptide transporter, POT family
MAWLPATTDVQHQAPSPSTTRDHGFFGQPRPLASLFGVEMWERFSFYGMQAILTIYLYFQVSQGGLGIPQASAASIVGAYGGLVYLSTIPGAWLADRLLGSERVLFHSAVLIMFGHLALAVLPGLVGVGVGLLTVGLGSGGLKANATAIVGTLYAEGDERRDAGFSLFCMGINIGALVGPLLTGLAQTEMGFHYGFGLAALGMALGLGQYVVGRCRLPDASRVVHNPLPRSRYPVAVAVVVAVVAVVAVCVAAGLLRASNLATVTIILTVVASVAYFAVILSSARTSEVERSRVVAFIPLFLASATFWSLFQQQFTVVAIYADQRLDRNLFGWEMPIAWVQSINPIFIIAFAGVFAAVWTKLGPRQPSYPLKFALGTMAMGVAFLVFLPMSGSGPGQAPLLGLVAILLMFTVAELLLSPVGLSLTTKLAPESFQTQMVALFFLSIALGTSVAGWMAGFYGADNETAYFGLLGAGGLVLGGVIAALTPFIRRRMHGVH